MSLCHLNFLTFASPPHHPPPSFLLQKKMEIKSNYLKHDRTLLIADPRRAESKKFGGSGARSRYAKSYR